MKSYVVPPSRPPDQEKAFHDHARQEGRLLCAGGWACILLLMLVFWPTDLVVYGPDMQLMLAKIRSACIVISLAYLFALYNVEYVRRYPFRTTLPGLCLGLFLIAFWTTEMGGLDTPAFYWTYMTPSLTMICITLTLRERIVATFAVSTVCLLGYFGHRPDYLSYALAGPPIIMLHAADAVSILAGHLIHNLYRTSYFRGYDLDKQKERSEELLLNILPEEIADRLKHDDQFIADGYEEATVIFADIVEFTPLADELSPDSVVMLLDDIFSSFDELISNYDAEKIKTIGDEYFVVSGVPQSTDDHARTAADLAMAMLAEVNKYHHEVRGDFDIRIGMHTGPIVAGVIGTDKFVYDVWGDTVNVGSRMESQGLPGKIQVTPQTKQAIEQQSNGQYDFDERGGIEVKGKGIMTTYFLEESNS